ncbi:nuclear receptor corepressor 1-like [Actinia tenebrosa]|uniref:Nuclear receptor corepressor 1-like n=1 Tax=Actinia tenebrosa TaxID=6105 RepID=A0A6P8IFU0_ACTTE|nr:nuclear receptor corepressor 1-like [Actinia tenebrosa]
MQITKVKILTPHLQRSDIFYNKWKKEEIKIFEKLYVKLSRSGNKRHVFESIANNLPNKTTRDCVQYYYLFKNIGTFKTKLRKGKKKKTKSPCTTLTHKQ